MRLLFFGLSYALADPVPVDCNRVEGKHGETITCPNDQSPKYVTGLCTSAQSTHCGSNSSKSHEYICCDEYEIQPHRHCYNLYGTYGQKQVCKDPTDILIGGCASGRNEDCTNGLREELEAEQKRVFESNAPYIGVEIKAVAIFR